MGEKKQGVGMYVSCIALGVATLKFGSSDIAWLGYVLGSIGGATTVMDVARNANPYKILFKNLKLQVNGQIPRLIKKRKTDYGHCLTFSLPYGLSTKDFEKNKLEIEQYLNKKIEIAYDNYRVFVKIFEDGLKVDQEYKFIPTKNILEFCIGVTYGNKIVKLDLEKAVHVLIAAETGGGKSTLLRGVITNIILSNKKVALHLIDLKNGAEFNVFRKCKMVKTFSRTIEEAEKVLSNLLGEVDRRYNLFYENDVVDIREYNKLKKGRLDYQIIIIDEFADLQSEKGSISAIETLSAKARACGIHLIVSTQRPDAQILNGRIKANIPCVIGMKTTNSLNSRIIIDQDGLERLKGKGHAMLKHGGITEFQSMYLDVKTVRELIKDTYVEKKVEIKKIEKIEDFSFLEMLK